MHFKKHTQFFLALDQTLDLFCVEDVASTGQGISHIFHVGCTKVNLPFSFVVLM